MDDAPRSLVKRPEFLFVLLAFALAPGSPGGEARAQGFGVYEQGTCAMGRGGATVAAPCGDGSSLFYNPAGLAGQPGLTLSGGVTAVLAQGSFTDDRTATETELDNDLIPVPHLYAHYGVSERLSVGVGAYVPYGLGTTWPSEDFDGRFLGYDSQLQSVYVQPTAAYQVLPGRLSVGAGLTVVFGSVELNRRLDLANQSVPGGGATFAQLGIPPRTDFADAGLDGSGTGVGGHFGARFRVTDGLSIGARYLTAVGIDYGGEASFEQVDTGLTLPADNPLMAPAGTPLDQVLADQFDDDGGALADQNVETQITQPAQFVAGLSAKAAPGLMLFFDYTWTGWSAFDRLELQFENEDLDQKQVENYQNTSALRVGTEYAFSSDGGSVSDGLTLRGGYTYNTSAAPAETVTPLLPESNRNQFTIGLGYPFTPAVGIDLAYQYLGQNDRRGRVQELSEDFDEEGFDPATNSGLYRFNAHLLAATLTVQL
jgi:long-chain fatty acid transport protein